MSKEVDAALELLKGAIRRETYAPSEIVRFMGMTPYQINRLRWFYEKTTGMKAENIE